MAESRPRIRKPYKPRGVPVEIGTWWLELMIAAFGTKKDTEIAERVTSAAKPGFTYDRKEIERLRKGQDSAVLTIELTTAICRAFSLINPVFIATSKEEAEELLAVRHKHERLQREALQDIVDGSVVAKDDMLQRVAGKLTDAEIRELAALKERNDAKAKERAIKTATAKKARQMARDRH